MPSAGDRSLGSRAKRGPRWEWEEAAQGWVLLLSSAPRPGHRRVVTLTSSACRRDSATQLFCWFLLGPHPCLGSLEGRLRTDTLHSISLQFNKFIYISGIKMNCEI